MTISHAPRICIPTFPVLRTLATSIPTSPPGSSVQFYLNLSIQLVGTISIMTFWVKASYH